VSLNPADPNVRLAQFGRQVELFLEGDIGSFLLERAESQIEEAVRELKKTDPYNGKAIQTLQNRIEVAESIAQWLGETIQQGHQAMEELKNAQS